MPILKPEPLERLTRHIFEAITVPPAGAAWMATLLVRANLRGHDSHGVIRVPQYVASWKKKESDPRAEPTVVQEGPATALVDGKKGFGQIVAKRGMEVAMEKAAAIGVACVGVHNSNHIGRLANLGFKQGKDGFDIEVGGIGSPGAIREAKPGQVHGKHGPL